MSDQSNVDDEVVHPDSYYGYASSCMVVSRFKLPDLELTESERQQVCSFVRDVYARALVMEGYAKLGQWVLVSAELLSISEALDGLKKFLSDEGRKGSLARAAT